MPLMWRQCRDKKGGDPSRIGLRTILLLLASIAVAVLLFLRAGRFIVAEDHFTNADTALVLSGDPVRRALAARDLYLQGRVKQILVIPEPPDQVEGELVKLGLTDPTLPPLSERILVASGVPRENISFLPTPADGTIVEAYRVRRFFEGRPPQRMAVITSKFASRRACFIFRWVLQHVEVLCVPTPYDPFEPDQWWKQPRNALYVAMEYQKFLANAFTLAFGLSGR